jgi:hypothetical protein
VAVQEVVAQELLELQILEAVVEAVTPLEVAQVALALSSFATQAHLLMRQA